MGQKKTPKKLTIRGSHPGCDYKVLKTRYKKNGQARKIDGAWCVIHNHWMDKHKDVYLEIINFSGSTAEELYDIWDCGTFSYTEEEPAPIPWDVDRYGTWELRW